MEQIMPFIFGMLTMIGAVAATIIVVGIVKIFKQSAHVRLVNSEIDKIWPAMDSNNVSMHTRTSNVEQVMYRSIESSHAELQRRIDELSLHLEKLVEDETATIDRRIDNVDSSLGSRIDDVSEEINDRFDDVNDQITDLTETVTDGDLEVAQAASSAIENVYRDMEEKAKNSQSYIDSRIDKLDEKFSAGKTKELLKG